MTGKLIHKKWKLFKDVAPCPEEEMRERGLLKNRNTICEVLRRIYHSTEDENIRADARIATTMAKGMNRKLSEYYERFKRNNPGTKRDVL